MKILSFIFIFGILINLSSSLNIELNKIGPLLPRLSNNRRQFWPPPPPPPNQNQYGPPYGPNQYENNPNANQQYGYNQGNPYYYMPTTVGFPFNLFTTTPYPYMQQYPYGKKK
ncbi:hypothetical protein PVAND_013049 [Polypedilum vanderplanki]|uniref:Uncharacterized protein n=1 Tax=Polypedilum vanderplanki TaxID=319348 RepID=A0A9J6CNH0_POLVA|nr:hypothetical protein PVAND_013049 [Polypedilum vanderplanki]